jgi:hypothetical protein
MKVSSLARAGALAWVLSRAGLVRASLTPTELNVVGLVGHLSNPEIADPMLYRAPP